MRFGPDLEFQPKSTCSYLPVGTMPDLGGSRIPPKKQIEESTTNQPPKPSHMWLVVATILAVILAAIVAVVKYSVSLWM